MGRISFVTDRFGKEAEIAELRRLAVFVGAALGAQLVDVGDRLLDVRPDRLHRSAVVGIAPVFIDQEEEFAVAVVLRHGIGAARVDAAGDLAAGELEGREPIDQLADRAVEAGAEQGRRGERAVADPGAGVGAGARLDGGAVAIDQDVREDGPESFDEPVGGGRKMDLDAIEALVPVAGGGGEGGGEIGGGSPPGRRMQRNQEIDGSLPYCWYRQIPLQSSRRKPERIRDLRRRGQSSLPEMLGDLTAVERRGTERGRRALRDHAPVAVHDRRVAVPGDLADRGDATRLVEKLRRRIHLERPESQEELEAPGFPAIVDEIAGAQYRSSRRSGGEGGDIQRKIAVPPGDGGDGEISLRQRLGRGDVAPGDQLAVDEEERLDRERPLPHLQGAVLAEQPLLTVAVDAHDRPVFLLAGERARIGAAGSVLRDVFEEGVERRRPVEGFDLDVTRRTRSPQPQIPRFRLRQI